MNPQAGLSTLQDVREAIDAAHAAGMEPFVFVLPLQPDVLERLDRDQVRAAIIRGALDGLHAVVARHIIAGGTAR